MKNNRLCFQWGVYLVDLPNTGDNVQCGIRPCICVSNDANNTWSNTAQFIPLTSQVKNNLPTHYTLMADKYKFLKTNSVVLAEQLTTQSADKVNKFLGRLDLVDIEHVKRCIMIEFNLY